MLDFIKKILLRKDKVQVICEKQEASGKVDGWPAHELYWTNNQDCCAKCDKTCSQRKKK